MMFQRYYMDPDKDLAQHCHILHLADTPKAYVRTNFKFLARGRAPKIVHFAFKQARNYKHDTFIIFLNMFCAFY